MRVFLGLISQILFLSLASAETPKTIKVGVSPVMSTAGIFIAQEKGYFKDAGLNVELMTFDSSGGAMTPLLGKGELDVGAGNISCGLINAIGEGVSIKIVADKGHTSGENSYMGLLVREDHIKSGRYKSLKDLKGFKIGLTSLGGVSQQILFEKFLAKANLKATDVEYLKLTYPEMNVALEKKELDATIQLEPLLSAAENRGFAKKVADASEVYPEQQSGALFYSEAFSKSEKDAVAFMSAYIKGVNDYNRAFVDKKQTGRAAIIAILDKHLKIEPTELWEKIRPVGLNPAGNLNTDLLKNDLKWYLEKGYSKKEVKIEQIVDNTFVEKARKTN